MFAYLPGLLAPLLFLAGFMLRGRRGGTSKPSAFTTTREHGTPTQGTGTTAECSSPSTLGNQWADALAQTWQHHANSFTGHGLSTDATVTPGGNGGRRDYAD